MKRPPLETQMYSFATVTLFLVLIIIISSQVMGQEISPFSPFRRSETTTDRTNPLRKDGPEEFTVETLTLSPIVKSAKAVQSPETVPATSIPAVPTASIPAVPTAPIFAVPAAPIVENRSQNQAGSDLSEPVLPTLEMDTAVVPVSYEQIEPAIPVVSTESEESFPTAPFPGKSVKADSGATLLAESKRPSFPSDVKTEAKSEIKSANLIDSLPDLQIPTPDSVPVEIPIPGLQPVEDVPNSAPSAPSAQSGLIPVNSSEGNATLPSTPSATETETIAPDDRAAIPCPEVSVPRTPVPGLDSTIKNPAPQTGASVGAAAATVDRPKSAAETSISLTGNPQDWADEIGRQIHEEVAEHGCDFAWKKGELEIVPYGIIWASMSFENHPSVIGSSAFFLQPPSNVGNQCHLDYRGTILGFNIKGPKIGLFPHAKMQGKVEFDLQRTIDYENKATVHLRHCYWEAASDEWRLLAGQTWDVVSPLLAGTLMYDAGWMDGNVGYRRAQVRLERFWNVSQCAQWKWQGCLSAPFNADAGSLLNYDKSNFRVKAGTYPIIQSRIAYVLGDRNGKEAPVEIGLSGHVGEMQYGLIGTPDDNTTEKTWGIYLDARIPFNSRFGVQGELFKGENLSMFLGGIGQGVYKNSLGEAEAIDAQGGWINLWCNLTEKLQWRVGYMIDDPTNNFDNVTTSVKTLNQSLFTNLTYQASKNLRFGIEYNHLQTTYAGADAGTSKGDRLDFISTYFF